MTITRITVRDIRFPTARQQDGSDALNAGDYSATYVVLETDTALEGHGLTFTNGRGNEIVVAAVHALSHHVIGLRLDDIIAGMRTFYRNLTMDAQLRWLGPEKGILHMATGAVLNAVWDLWAKREGKPMWKHLVDLSPEALAGHVPQPSFDLWSLSLVLYQSFAGRHPLAGDSVVDVVKKVQRGSLPDIRDFRPDSPAVFAAFLNDALSPVAARRPSSAADLRTRLRWLQGHLFPQAS